MKRAGWPATIKRWLYEAWRYIWHGDSVVSFLLLFVFAYAIMKFLIFPGVGLVLDTSYPVVAIVSGSMEHKIVDHRICANGIRDIEERRLSFDQYWDFCGSYYEDNFNITAEMFKEFPYANGLNTGDMMVLYGYAPEDIQIGDILVFNPESSGEYQVRGPIIHRVVDKRQDASGDYLFQTKGDHNGQSVTLYEKDITEEQILGVAVFRVPYVGYPKTFLSEGIAILMGVSTLLF